MNISGHSSTVGSIDSKNPEETYNTKYESWRKKASVQEQHVIDYFSDILDGFAEESIADSVFNSEDDDDASLENTNTICNNSNKHNSSPPTNIDQEGLKLPPLLEEHAIENLIISNPENCHNPTNTETLALNNTIKGCGHCAQPHSIDLQKMNSSIKSITKLDTWRKKASVQEQYVIDYFSEILDEFEDESSTTDSDSVFGAESYTNTDEKDSHIDVEKSINDKVENLKLAPPVDEYLVENVETPNSLNSHHAKDTEIPTSNSTRKTSPCGPQPRAIDLHKINLSSNTIAKLESWRKKASVQEQCAIDFFSEILAEFGGEAIQDTVSETDDSSKLEDSLTNECNSDVDVNSSLNISGESSQFRPMEEEPSTGDLIPSDTLSCKCPEKLEKEIPNSIKTSRGLSTNSNRGNPIRIPRNEYKIELYKTTESGTVRHKLNPNENINQVISEREPSEIKSTESSISEQKTPAELQHRRLANTLNKRKKKHELVYSTVRSVEPKQKSNLHHMAGLSRSSLLS